MCGQCGHRVLDPHLKALLQRPQRGLEVFPRLPDRAAHEASGTAPPTFFAPYDHPV